jgi:hypothetical protein
MESARFGEEARGGAALLLRLPCAAAVPSSSDAISEREERGRK